MTWGKSNTRQHPCSSPGFAASCSVLSLWVGGQETLSPIPAPSTAPSDSTAPGMDPSRLLLSQGAAEPSRDLALSQPDVIQCSNISQGLGEIGTWATGSWQLPVPGEEGREVKMCLRNSRGRISPVQVAPAGPELHPSHLQWAPTPARLRPPPGLLVLPVWTPCTSGSLESTREAQPQHGPKAGGRPPATPYVHSIPKKSTLWRQIGQCAGWATCAPLQRWIPGARGDVTRVPGI